MNRILIDTNIYSGALRGDQDIVGVLRQAEHIGLSVISMGELFSGFKGGAREEENKRQLGIFLDSPRVALYPVDEYTAQHYCAVLDQLRRSGTPIPTNDVWIAAAAFQHGLPLFTRDSHFSKIEGLLLR
ncbi:MAG: type II toxin-antitoxin system VapC family toxin [Desulfomicrobium sp.]|nr:type II toxin-antitoxin system VapC family toxin [Pseudomonadota bacterium]MBV1711633.1 type II toxin-antitoxin system VapC family toxin [Desulfomicrobium sp.]MBU4569697.1 type II toxin-antitoxin system VapC family toxin [Pseudomonadota bacterium]MBU4595417.1 type II toxin-antitoxin system VapC family toxin [Pseudomonadota bacterium]MBV1718708.1 type II toxin-antitoxin system VapC family toxin [Desulfomicrobium sp.]